MSAVTETVISESVLFSQKRAAKYLDVGVSWLRTSDLRRRELPGHGPKGKPLIRYHKDDLDAQIARWNEEQRGGKRRKA